MKCPFHDTELLIIDQLNKDTWFCRCDTFYHAIGKNIIHTILIINYEDKLIPEIKTD